jgi:hypothetical protein
MLGLWNAFMWNAEETGSGDVIFNWHPLEPFVWQFLFGYALFIGGHILFDRLYPRTLRPNRIEHLLLWALAAGLSVLTAIGWGLLALYPVLPLLVAVCLWTLRRGMPRTAGPTYVDQLHETPVPLWRFALTLIIPAMAFAVYAAVVAAEWPFEANVLLIVTAGPLSVGIFFWSLFAVWQQARAT